MELKIKKIENPDIDILMGLANKFKFNDINLSFYESIFEFYDGNELIGIINYCILPSMTGKDRVFIRNLFYLDEKYIYDIIKSLCKYSKKKNLTINTSLENTNFNNKCKKAFYDNNFTGNDWIYYIY
jgi:hypothetical protein